MEAHDNNELIQVILITMVVGIYLLTGSAFAVLQVLYLLTAYYFCKKLFNHSTWSIAIGKETMGIYMLHMPIIIYGVYVTVKLVTEDKITTPIVIWISTFIVSYFVSRRFSYSRVGSFVFGNYRF